MFTGTLGCSRCDMSQLMHEDTVSLQISFIVEDTVSLQISFIVEDTVSLQISFTVFKSV
jgi:hypothetical protein